MKTYEGLFLLNAQKANRDWDQVFGHVRGLIEKHGGQLVRTDKWGERKLAYPIQREKRGCYLLAYFTAEGDAVTRIYRECELSDTVLRAMVIAVTVVPEPKAPPAEASEARREARAAMRGPGGPGSFRPSFRSPAPEAETEVEKAE